MYAVIIGLTLGTHSLSAVTVTWDGSAGTGAWATGANWDSGSRPANGDDLIFDANAANSQFTLTLAAVAGTLLATHMLTCPAFVSLMGRSSEIFVALLL